ncbi:MAG: hypothetical protein HKO02_09865 [Hyphomonadaceae bacterium]|nr:hypothetical protein [Hyphomonadaceae bacterium]
MKTPQDKYGSPSNVIADKALSISEKKEILRTWIDSEEALARATAEGLDGGRQSMLRSLQLALQSLDTAYSHKEE